MATIVYDKKMEKEIYEESTEKYLLDKGYSQKEVNQIIKEQTEKAEYDDLVDMGIESCF